MAYGPDGEGPSIGLAPRFERVYICLAVCKRGFVAGCRPIIGLDGSHLKGPFGGMLLTAIGVDPNDRIFPISFAATEGETKDSWLWFLECLLEDIGNNHGRSWTFISDQQKGLVPALAQMVPDVPHRLCVRHLCGCTKNINCIVGCGNNSHSIFFLI